VANLRPCGVNTVLFDLDDTLLNSYDARIKALQDVFTRAEIPGLDAVKLLSDLQGAPFQDALVSLAMERNITGNLFNLYRRIYWLEKTGHLRLYPGVKMMLGKLKSRGCKLGIVTSKLRDSEFEGRRIGCVHELKELGVSALFSVIIGFEDVSKYKPHPEGIILALERINSLPGSTLFVGDSAADIQAALSAGCLSCHATWGITDDNNLPQNLKPHYTVKAPGALLSLDCI
jgi:phosphoglycolate phosphatase-like HAD superfamily hydrolase